MYRNTIQLLLLAPLWADSDKEFEVYAWHWAREYREVFLVEKVIDYALERQICPFEFYAALERDVAHIVRRQFACQRDVVRRHRVAFAIVAPLVQELPFRPGQTSRQR